MKLTTGHIPMLPCGMTSQNPRAFPACPPALSSPLINNHSWTSPYSFLLRPRTNSVDTWMTWVTPSFTGLPSSLLLYLKCSSGPQGSSFWLQAHHSLGSKLLGAGGWVALSPLLGLAAWGWWREGCSAVPEPRLISAWSCCGHSISFLPLVFWKWILQDIQA